MRQRANLAERFTQRQGEDVVEPFLPSLGYSFPGASLP